MVIASPIEGWLQPPDHHAKGLSLLPRDYLRAIEHTPWSNAERPDAMRPLSPFRLYVPIHGRCLQRCNADGKSVGRDRGCNAFPAGVGCNIGDPSVDTPVGLEMDACPSHPRPIYRSRERREQPSTRNKPRPSQPPGGCLEPHPKHVAPPAIFGLPLRGRAAGAASQLQTRMAGWLQRGCIGHGEQHSRVGAGAVGANDSHSRTSQPSRLPQRPSNSGQRTHGREADRYAASIVCERLPFRGLAPFKYEPDLDGIQAPISLASVN